MHLFALVDVRMNRQSDLAVGRLDLGICCRPCNAKDGVVVSHGAVKSACHRTPHASRAEGRRRWGAKQLPSHEKINHGAPIQLEIESNYCYSCVAFQNGVARRRRHRGQGHTQKEQRCLRHLGQLAGEGYGRRAQLLSGWFHFSPRTTTRSTPAAAAAAGRTQSSGGC